MVPSHRARRFLGRFAFTPGIWMSSPDLVPFLQEPSVPDLSAQGWAEPYATYLERSTMGCAIQARRRLREWLRSIPQDERSRLAREVSAVDERTHLAAVWELAVHQILLRLGLQPTPHPEMADMETRPDWMVSEQFYLEATLVADSDQRTGEEKRLNETLDALFAVESPDFLFRVEVQRYGQASPSRRRLRAFVRTELQRLEHEKQLRLYEDTGSLAGTVWEESGWRFKITFVPVEVEARGKHTRSMESLSTGMEMSTPGRGTRTSREGEREVSLEQKIRGAVNKKAGHYGSPDLPLVVALNITHWMGDQTLVRNALFGTEVYVFNESGARVEGRPDGALRPDRNRRVSAILVACRQTAFGCSGAILYLNPWASRPFERSLLPISSVAVDLAAGRFVESPAQREWAEVLGFSDS